MLKWDQQRELFLLFWRFKYWKLTSSTVIWVAILNSTDWALRKLTPLIRFVPTCWNITRTPSLTIKFSKVLTQKRRQIISKSEISFYFWISQRLPRSIETFLPVPQRSEIFSQIQKRVEGNLISATHEGTRRVFAKSGEKPTKTLCSGNYYEERGGDISKVPHQTREFWIRERTKMCLSSLFVSFPSKL